MNPEKILIFDTENIISNRVESLLIKFGYKQNHFVDNFQEGENLLKRITFDLIICKISFPLEDTVLFLERVLKNIETPVVYIVDEGKESLYKKDKLPNHHLFLIFPFNPLTFRSVLEIYFKSLKEKRLKEVFIIRKNKTQIEIPFDQIFWINSEKKLLQYLY